MIVNETNIYNSFKVVYVVALSTYRYFDLSAMTFVHMYYVCIDKFKVVLTQNQGWSLTS